MVLVIDVPPAATTTSTTQSSTSTSTQSTQGLTCPTVTCPVVTCPMIETCPPCESTIATCPTLEPTTPCDCSSTCHTTPATGRLTLGEIWKVGQQMALEASGPYTSLMKMFRKNAITKFKIYTFTEICIWAENILFFTLGKLSGQELGVLEFSYDTCIISVYLNCHLIFRDDLLSLDLSYNTDDMRLFLCVSNRYND